MPEHLVERQISQQRILYVLLLLGAVGVGIAIWVMVNLIFAEQAQLKKLNEIAQAQQQTITQIKQGVAELKISNELQTAYLQCLLSALNVGDFPSNCQPPAQVVPPVPEATSSNPVTAQMAPASVSSSPAPPPSNPGAVQKTVQGVGGVVQKVLKLVGL